MTLDNFYEIYKLHRQYSVGQQFPTNHPLYEEEFNKSEFEKIYTSSGMNSEDDDAYYFTKLFKALWKDYELCMDVFKSLDLDFFFWFTTNFDEWFDAFIKKYKKLELLDYLKEHVYSFNNSLATERMDKIYKNCISFCK